MVRSLKTELLLTILVFNLWLCIFLIFRTSKRIFRLREEILEELERKGQK